jgi:hypothetical protein
MKPTTILSTIIIFILTVSSFSFQITGLVFEDKNANGILDADEAGVANVGVSDGNSVVLTDTKGKYILPEVNTTAAFIFVSVPSGYTYNSTFYYSLDSQPPASNFNFALQKVKGRLSNYFIQVTDVHIGNASDAADLSNAITELNQLNPPPGFIIDSGDMVNKGSDIALFELYKTQINRSRFRWYCAFGNHDANPGENRAVN